MRERGTMARTFCAGGEAATERPILVESKQMPSESANPRTKPRLALSWAGLHKGTRTLIVIPVVYLCLFLVAWLFIRAESKTFYAMTPAQHLEAARAKVKQFDVPGRNAAEWQVLFDDVRRELDALPVDSARSEEGRKLRASLTKAQEWLNGVEQQGRQEAAAKSAFPTTLQNELKDRGYGCTVATSSDAPDEIAITSKDFNDTDHRVRFLAFLRGRNYDICATGFRKVRLKSGWFEFSESYNLECGAR
jgi:hypothetical protein